MRMNIMMKGRIFISAIDVNFESVTLSLKSRVLNCCCNCYYRFTGHEIKIRVINVYQPGYISLNFKQLKIKLYDFGFLNKY